MSVVIKSTALIGALALISKVSAHGTVQGIVAGGKWYSGYSPSFQYQNPPPVVAGWSTPENIDNGFVSDYTSPDIICHKGATPGGAYVTVAAGDTVELQWTVWPESHHGPMLDYLASCGDDCTTVDKTQLQFNKIDEAGLVDGSSPPGTWASDQMIANNNSWVVTIPSGIAPGKYVLRHETIALHSAFDVGGAQNYPQCINLEITGSGTTSLSGGTVGTSLYDAQDPGLFINIYTAISSYIIPGPALWDGASSGTTQPSGSSSASASNSASASATSSSSSIAATTAPFSTSTGTGTSTSTSTVVTITRRPSKHNHVAVISSSTADAATTSAAVATTSSSVAVAPAETETETECSSEPIETPSAPASFSSMVAVTSDAVAVAAAVTTAPTSTPSTGTSPVSFTSTITGRIGQSTKFVCYLVD